MPPSPSQYAVVAIPLNRPEVVPFVMQHARPPQGARIQIVGQRPTEQAEHAWLTHLTTTTTPSIDDLLAMDDPQHHLVETHTDRLVPMQFLSDPEYLTRNLGGWGPIYFGVVGRSFDAPDDPLLQQLEVLTEYGSAIRWFGADSALVSSRLEHELDGGLAAAVVALRRLFAIRQQHQNSRFAYIGQLYAAIADGHGFATQGDPALPRVLLLDELLGQLMYVEQARRHALAEDRPADAEAIEMQQRRWRDEYGLTLILKGEYIAGRHRRSTVMIARELGVVVKQPAPEPLHEIQLAARTVDGLAENWPYTTGDGALVTPRGRLRLVVEEGLIPKLDAILDHQLIFSTFTGLTIERFVTGPTLQEWVRADHTRLTSDIYDQIVTIQQLCELLDGENGDWHSANFIVNQTDNELIHIDWGAARLRRPDENTPEGWLARINQVQNISFSFHDQELADLTVQRHTELMADQERLARIEERARQRITT
ncbi:MAG: hypothetical protein AAGF95_05885 [Chloroflexota bacterium]